MTDLHPNWQATDAGAEPVTVHAAAPDVEPDTDPPIESSRTLTRQPAAIAGILLTLSIGLALFYGRTLFTLSSAPGSSVIHITRNGFVPAQVQVAQGDSITWMNDTSSAQGLASDELCTTSHACLSTGLIAPESSASLILADEFLPGTYHYYSISMEGVQGTVTVSGSSRPREKSLGAQAALENALPLDSSSSSAESASSAQESSGESSSSAAAAETDPLILTAGESSSSSSEDGVVLTSGDESSSEEGQEFTSSASSLITDQSGRLPVNPFAVDGVQGQGPGTVGVGSTGGLHGGAPLPDFQPETGPGVWLAVLAALGAVFMIVHRGQRSKYLYK